jgi:general stress protein 26
MQIIDAMGAFFTMTEEEADRLLLESKLNLQLATIDEKGDPNIQPVWYSYDKDKRKLYIMTYKTSKKIHNIRKKAIIYFSIDEENPYKGVEGKGVATIVEDPDMIMPMVEKINLKYLGTLEDPSAKTMIENVRNGTIIMIGINPKFFFTWNLAKM